MQGCTNQVEATTLVTSSAFSINNMDINIQQFDLTDQTRSADRNKSQSQRGFNGLECRLGGWMEIDL